MSLQWGQLLRTKTGIELPPSFCNLDSTIIDIWKENTAYLVTYFFFCKGDQSIGFKEWNKCILVGPIISFLLDHYTSIPMQLLASTLLILYSTC